MHFYIPPLLTHFSPLVSAGFPLVDSGWGKSSEVQSCSSGLWTDLASLDSCKGGYFFWTWTNRLSNMFSASSFCSFLYSYPKQSMCGYSIASFPGCSTSSFWPIYFYGRLVHIRSSRQCLTRWVRMICKCYNVSVHYTGQFSPTSVV